MCGWLLSFFLFSHLLWRKHLWILHLAIILHLIIASLNLYQNISTEVFPDFLKHIFKYSFQKHIMAKLISFQNFSTSTQNLSWSYFMVSPTMFSLPSYLSCRFHHTVLYLFALPPSPTQSWDYLSWYPQGPVQWWACAWSEVGFRHSTGASPWFLDTQSQ